MGEEELLGEKIDRGRERADGVGRGGQRAGSRGQMAPILADFGEVDGHNRDGLSSWATA